LGIQPGDEVITVPFTWVSTTEAIAMLGAIPVFVDIDPETFLIDLHQVEAAITPRTKAILPVSLFGQMPDFSKLQMLARHYKLKIIEDGAQSFGATQNRHLSCSLADIGSTSFFPTKPLGCYGDGGALFTNDDQLAEKMRAIRTHGSLTRDHHLYIGMTGRLDTIQAAVLQVKMSYFQQEIEARKEKADYYSKELEKYCQIPKIQRGNTHVYAQYTIRTPKRDQLVTALEKQNIPTRVYYAKCIHEQPAYSYLNYKQGDFPIAEKTSKEVCSLPFHPWLTEEEQDQVIQAVKEGLSYD
jgi:UDP-2-acetamido-2-deoxy-ribo-hexuluronate aminotransferase